MSVCCIGPICVPYSALWPLLVFLAKYLWERFGSLLRRLVGLEKKKAAPAAGCASCNNEAAKEVAAVESMADWKARVGKTTAGAGAGRPLVVDFSAPWCKPCKKIAPLFSQLAQEYAAAADFASCDIDAQADVATDANVLAVPTFQVYVDGIARGQLQGADDGKLRSLLEAHLGPAPETTTTTHGTEDTCQKKTV